MFFWQVAFELFPFCFHTWDECNMKLTGEEMELHLLPNRRSHCSMIKTRWIKIRTPPKISGTQNAGNKECNYIPGFWIHFGSIYIRLKWAQMEMEHLVGKINERKRWTKNAEALVSCSFVTTLALQTRYYSYFFLD